MTYQDKTLSCTDCGQNFVFGVAEQEQFAQNGYRHDPGRCPSCRAASRARRESRMAAGRGDTGMNHMRRDPVGTAVTCSNCGKPTQVPFVPSGNRPVYCSDCYRKIRNR